MVILYHRFAIDSPIKTIQSDLPVAWFFDAYHFADVR